VILDQDASFYFLEMPPMQLQLIHPARRTRLQLSWLIAAGLCLVIRGPQPAFGHEGGHPALPSTGASVHGDLLMLSPSASKAIGLKTAKVVLCDLERSIAANATLEIPCHHHAYATTLVTGRVTEVLAHPGDAVAAGQELARLESVALETLQMEMLQASDELAFADRLLAHREKLENAISGRILLETVAARQQKASQFSVAWQKLRSLGLTHEQLDQVRSSGRPIRSLAVTTPIAGVVSEAHVRVGEIIQPIEHLYHIVDASELWATAQVLESDLRTIRLGLPVKVKLDAHPDRLFTAQIEYIGLTVDPVKHTLDVRVTLDNADGLLRPGLFGQLWIVTQRSSKAIVAPAEAIVDDSRGPFALLEDEPGKILRRAVKIGLRTPQQVEILDGLFPGDQLVTTGVQELGGLFPSRPVALFGKDGPSEVSVGRTSSAEFELPRNNFRPIQAQIELPTDGKAFASTNIHGRLSRILVERGDRVRAGDVLAEVESLELKNWQLELLQTRVLLNLTKTSLDRMQPLSGGGSVPEKELWQLRAKYESYRHAEQSLIQKLRMAGLSSEEIQQIEKLDLTDPQAGEKISMALSIRAPLAGEIANFELSLGQVVSPNELVSPNEHLFEIQDLTRVWAKGYVFERDAGQLAVGQEVEVQLVSDPGFRVSARVTRVSPLVTSAERIFAVWAEIDNPEGKLKEGMLARMFVKSNQPTRSLAAEPQTPRARPSVSQ
jgi:cobalt-zinc-cadmium efflux system membrane fusion protein